MAIIKTINLTPDTDIIRKEKFGEDKGNFSAWVQQHLLDLKKQDSDPKYIETKINSITADMMTLATEKSYWVEKKQNIEAARQSSKEKESIELPPKVDAFEKKKHNLYSKAGTHLQFHLGIKNYEKSHPLAEELAALWLKDENKNKPQMQVLVEFANSHNLVFEKDYPFLQDYKGQYKVKDNSK